MSFLIPGRRRLAEPAPDRVAGALALLACVLLLGGCAAAVVGGAATGAAMAHDRRSAGTVIDDQTIELKAHHLLTEHPEISEHSSLSVVSYNHVLLLTGQASSEETRQRFVSLAAGIPKVERVVDEVTIGPAPSFTEHARDAYVTSKVKTALFAIDLPTFDPTRVKVVTQLGTVYLMGLVTQEEAEAVVRKVRLLDGVGKVVRVFEYVTP